MSLDRENDHLISQAEQAFKKNKLVAIPTETVYGLAAPIDQPELIKKIFTLKERPFFDPLIIHVSSIEQAQQLSSNWSDTAERIAKHFWPGPLTMVLPKKNHVSDLITSGLPTVGIRFPQHPLTQKLINHLGTPLAAPSANKFKQTSPTKPEHVKNAFSEEDVYILDGGDSRVGIESTILDLSQDPIQILRPGMLTPQDFEAIGVHCVLSKQNTIEAPGMMEDHYMPKKPLFLCDLINNDKIMAYLESKNLNSYEELKLPEEPVIAARSLYSLLHQASIKDALVCSVKLQWFKNPQWQGILDRLKKASSGLIDDLPF